MKNIVAVLFILISIASRAQQSDFYTVQYGGGDLCSQLATTIASLPPSGGSINVIGLSSLAPANCNSNPFAGNNSNPKPIHLSLGPGIIDTTVQWLISRSNVYINGAGSNVTLFVYTGTTSLLDPSGGLGGIIEFDSSAPQTTLIYSVGLSDIFISGNKHSPYGLLLDGVHHSKFKDISVWNVVNSGIEVKFGVANTYFRPHVTAADAVAAGITQSVTPVNGISLDGENPDYSSTASTITDPIAEYVSGCGIELMSAFGNTITSGTSESNGTSGNTATGNICLPFSGEGHPNNNTFISIDTEAPSSGENLIDHGNSNQYINVNFDQTADIFAASDVFTGGHAHLLRFNQGALDNEVNNVLVGNIIDNGINTSLYAILNENSNFYPGLPFQQRSTTFSGVNPIGVSNNSSDFLTGEYTFNVGSSTVLSNTLLTVGAHWHAIFSGQWLNSGNGSGMAQLAPWIEISDTNPIVTAESCIVTFAISSGGNFQGTGGDCTGKIIVFSGRIFIVPGNNNSTGTTAIKTADAVDAGSYSVNGITGVSGNTCTQWTNGLCTHN